MNKILSDMPIYKGMFYIYESRYKKAIHKRPMSVDIMQSLLIGYNFANAYGSYYEQMPEGLKVLADAIRENKIKLPHGKGLSLRQAYQILTKIQEEGLKAGEVFFENEDFNRIKIRILDCTMVLFYEWQNMFSGGGMHKTRWQTAQLQNSHVQLGFIKCASK